VKGVADHQGGEHQGGMIRDGSENVRALARGFFGPTWNQIRTASRFNPVWPKN
jgi:hypothetical protein